MCILCFWFKAPASLKGPLVTSISASQTGIRLNLKSECDLKMCPKIALAQKCAFLQSKRPPRNLCPLIFGRKYCARKFSGTRGGSRRGSSQGRPLRRFFDTHHRFCSPARQVNLCIANLPPLNEERPHPSPWPADALQSLALRNPRIVAKPRIQRRQQHDSHHIGS